MVAKTHIAGGILAAEAVGIFAMGITDQPIYYFLTLTGSAVIGSVIPDIDHWNSTITKSNPVTKGISKVLRVFTSHRGVIHTFILWLAIGLILYWVGLPEVWNGLGLDIMVGLLVGVFSHLILDALNPAGIMMLWPIGKKKFHIARIKVGSANETTLAYILCAVDVVLFIYMMVLMMFGT